MIWGCFSWSGLGTASERSSWMYRMTRLSHRWIFFLPWWLGHIPDQQWQDSSGYSCERVEQEDAYVSGGMRSDFYMWIGHHRVLTFNPWLLKHLGCAGKDWRNGLTSLQNLGQKGMQLWMEMNVVTLHKFLETMPQLMQSVIKAKGGLLQKVVFFFWTGGVLVVYPLLAITASSLWHHWNHQTVAFFSCDAFPGCFCSLFQLFQGFFPSVSSSGGEMHAQLG